MLIKGVFDYSGNILIGVFIKLIRIGLFILLFYYFDNLDFNAKSLIFYVANIFILVLLIFKIYNQDILNLVLNFKLKAVIKFYPFLLISFFLLLSNIIDKYFLLKIINKDNLLKFAFLNDSSVYLLFFSNLFFTTAFYKMQLEKRLINSMLVFIGLFNLIFYLFYCHLYAFKKYNINSVVDSKFIYLSILLFIVYVFNSIHWFDLYKTSKIFSAKKYLLLTTYPTFVYYLLIFLFQLKFDNYYVFLFPQIVRLLLELYLFTKSKLVLERIS